MTNMPMNQSSLVGARSLRNRGVDRVYGAIVGAALTVIAIAMIYPLIFVISASISDPEAVNGGRMWLWPVGIQFQGYFEAFRTDSILIGYRNSLIYLLAGTTLDIFVTYTSAYALSRPALYGRGFFTFLILFTMWFSGGMIPTFLIVRALGLIDTPYVMIILGAVNAYNFIITRTYINSTISEEIQEAATIDGCTDFGLCWRIVFPLCGPIMAVLVLYFGLEHWNGYFKALLYVNDRNLQPLQIFLRDLLLIEPIQSVGIENDMEALRNQELRRKTLKYAVIVAASVPMLVIYPFLQRFFVKGLMIGAVKG